MKDTLYMARSARVTLETFSPNSENRRILKKFDDTFTRAVMPIKQCSDDKAFKKFCLDYFAGRHGEHIMPPDRFDTVLDSGFISHVVTYTKEEKVVAYVLIADDHTMSHFWFSFYDLEYVRQSLGLWLMLDCIVAAQKNGKKHFYVGTVYGEKGLYKTNFPNLEFWNGNEWINDATRLRELCRTDATHVFDTKDRYKELLSDVFIG